MSYSITVCIPHWQNEAETKSRIVNAKESVIPVNVLVLNWGKGSFDGEVCVEKPLAEVIADIRDDYVQFITPGSRIYPTKNFDCLNASLRPMYLDSQRQGETEVVINCESNRTVIEEIATGACPVTIDAALFSRHLLYQMVVKAPQGLARMGRRLLGGTDRWLILDTLAHVDYPMCSTRISSSTLRASSTRLSSLPFAKSVIGDLLYQHQSILSQRQADGFNAIAGSSAWDWSAMAFLQESVWGRAMLINCPEWLGGTLIHSVGCDTCDTVDKLPLHYEYYPNFFQALITDNPARDVLVWARTLKGGGIVATWVDPLDDEFTQVGGIWWKTI